MHSFVYALKRSSRCFQYTIERLEWRASDRCETGVLAWADDKRDKISTDADQQ